MSLADRKSLRLATLVVLYVAQGIPWGFMATTIPAYLASRGLDEGAVGVALATTTLPYTFKWRDNQSKWVMRRVLDRYVPQKLIDRPKTGFGVPFADWLRGPLRDWAENLLSESRLERDQLLDPRPIRERWIAHLAGTNWGYPLWDVLMLNAWLDANPGVSLA